MTDRWRVTPALDAVSAPAELAAHFVAWRRDTDATTTALRTLRAQVEEQARFLESPKAAVEYLDFFIEWFERALVDLAVMSDTPCGVGDDRSDAVRRLADAAVAEHHRVVGFRDKWINKPLPHEHLRPMLTAIATTVRDQLADYRELPLAVAKLGVLRSPASPMDVDNPAPQPARRDLDRRALFSQLLHARRTEHHD